jgi:hypothetical protein
LARGHFGTVSFDRLYNAVKRDVGRSRRHQFVTTMVDLYGLRGYPDPATDERLTASRRASRIEAEMAKGLPNPRFIPYIQVHEFEALVFVDLEQLVPQFPDGEASGAPARLRAQVAGLQPEEINDGIETAPSKRLIGEVPAYRHMKPVAGPSIAARIGLPKLRAACPHLDAWVSRLEQLNQSTALQATSE